jgi:hypothetical protein
MFPRMSAAIFAATVFVAADPVPNWNVEPSCHLVVNRTVPVGDMEICMNHERAARDQLAKEWSSLHLPTNHIACGLQRLAASRAMRIC